jgi:3-oxoacyl-[acyl-carrier-protein] synthase-1
MRRAVITGLGAVSCIGNNKEEILDSLKNGRSGIVANEMFKEMGLRSQVSGSCEIDFKEHIDRKVLRFMGDAAAYAYVAMQQCISDAGLVRRARTSSRRLIPFVLGVSVRSAPTA